MLCRKLRRFLDEDRAQDLIEYTLLMACMALVSVGLMSQAGNRLQGVWGGASSTIAVANRGAAVANATSPPSGGGGGDRDGHGDHGGQDGQ